MVIGFRDVTGAVFPLTVRKPKRKPGVDPRRIAWRRAGDRDGGRVGTRPGPAVATACSGYIRGVRKRRRASS